MRPLQDLRVDAARSARTAMADTIARPVAASAARCRSPKCPRVGSAAAAPMSSSRRPIARNARSLHRHRSNRSADAGNCNRPAATACCRYTPDYRAPGIARQPLRSRWRSPSNAMNVAMNVSWAICTSLSAVLLSSVAGNSARYAIGSQQPEHRIYLNALQQISMDAFCDPKVPFHNVLMTESFGVELGPLPLLGFGAWGKEPS